MINPFETEHEELLSLASDVVVENDVADTLLNEENIGEQHFLDFSKTKFFGGKPKHLYEVETKQTSDILVNKICINEQ